MLSFRHQLLSNPARHLAQVILLTRERGANNKWSELLITPDRPILDHIDLGKTGQSRADAARLVNPGVTHDQ